MSLPWWRGSPGSRDQEWKVIFWLIIVIAVMSSVLVLFVFISSVLGCGTVAECVDQTGIGSIFSRMPWLAPLCGAFLIFGVVAAILGMMYWRAVLDRRGYSGQYIRNRRPPE